MIRKLMLPALAIALLGGCATSAYQYRGGRGDYYYGQPSTQYRYYNSPYGYYGSPYGYSPYGYSGYGYGYYGYGGGFGYPYLPHGQHYRGDGHHHGHRDHDGDHGGGNHHGDRDRNGHDGGSGEPGQGGQTAGPNRPGFRPGPTWRDPGNLGISPPGRRYQGPAARRPPAAAPAVRSSGGSIGSRASGESTEGTSTDRKRRRIHNP